MPYHAEISRTSPTAILAVIDQSTSMSHHLDGGPSKAAFLADILNKTIYTIITNCSKADGVRDYFEIGVIAYSGNDARNGFKGVLGANLLNPVSLIAEHPIRVESRTKKIASSDEKLSAVQVKFPVWFDPQARGKTSMCAGLGTAIDVLSHWCKSNPCAFPPTVLHVTDGHPTDGDPEPFAEKLRMLGTEDGPCLLFNLHVDFGAQTPITFPDSAAHLPDRYAATLFRMSSILPDHVIRSAKSKGYAVQSGARGFVYNGSLEVVADFFDIGTRAAKTDAQFSNR